MPELREIVFDRNRPHVRLAPLPTDLSQWPELEYVGPLEIFVAGLSQLNPDLMEAAAARFTEDNRETLEYHELPVTPQDQKALIEEVRQIARLRDRFDYFELKWGN